MISYTENKAYIAVDMTNNFNPDKQHTLGSAVSISGTGLHTGVMADLTLKPANRVLVFSFNALIFPTNPLSKPIAILLPI